MNSGGVVARKARARKALREGQTPREEQELSHGLVSLLEAYGFLQTCRMPTFGEYLSPIPSTDILYYCEQMGWHGIDRYILIEAVRSMDNAYLDSVNNKKVIKVGGKGKHNRPQKIHPGSRR